MKTRIFRNIIAWVDNSHLQDIHEEGTTSKKIDWVRVVPFLGLHGMCLLIPFVGWSWIALATCAALYFIRMFAITGFYHRYFSHRTFKTNRFWQFIFAFWGNTSAQRGPLWWAGHHRHHHRHSDKEPDAHSPIVHEFMWSHMFWITSRSNFRTRTEEVKDLAKYPELAFLDRCDSLAPAVLGFAVLGWGWLAAAIWPEAGTGPWQMLIWGFFVSTVLLFHGTCTINSLSHLIGTRRYETTDHSRNNFVLALVTLGEGWHNNHHHYPASARNGFFWWEIDITYYGLWILEKLGIVSDLKPVPDHVKFGAGRAEATAP